MVDAESGEVHHITLEHDVEVHEEEHELVEDEQEDHELVEEEDHMLHEEVEEQILTADGEVLTIHGGVAKYEDETTEEMINSSDMQICYITTTSS